MNPKVQEFIDRKNAEYELNKNVSKQNEKAAFLNKVGM